MCGRYSLRQNDLHRVGADVSCFLPKYDEFVEKPRFNIAPSQDGLIVRVDAKGEPELSLPQWGFIPAWTKETPKLRPINARAETVATSGMFRQAFGRRRCLVLADGFYEWQGSKPPKQPYFIHMKDDGLFAFAGLWERWRPDDDAEPVETFTIITTTPNGVMSPIHNRMPVILSPRDYERWLDPKQTGESVLELLRPFAADGMEAYRISTRVNKPAHDGPELIEPEG